MKTAGMNQVYLTVGRKVYRVAFGQPVACEAARSIRRHLAGAVRPEQCEGLRRQIERWLGCGVVITLE